MRLVATPQRHVEGGRPILERYGGHRCGLVAEHLCPRTCTRHRHPGMLDPSPHVSADAKRGASVCDAPQLCVIKACAVFNNVVQDRCGGRPDGLTAMEALFASNDTKAHPIICYIMCDFLDDFCELRVRKNTLLRAFMLTPFLEANEKTFAPPSHRLTKVEDLGLLMAAQLGDHVISSLILRLTKMTGGETSISGNAENSMGDVEKGHCLLDTLKEHTIVGCNGQHASDAIKRCTCTTPSRE